MDTISPHPDVQGILLVINDQFERHPEKFGSPEIRKILQQEIVDYTRQHRGFDAFETPAFHAFFAERLQHYELTPLADVSVAFLQCYGMVKEAMAPTLALFGSYHDIHQNFLPKQRVTASYPLKKSTTWSLEMY